jgi:SAM-dependent methyltransferase
MPGLADWSSVAASAHADELREHILTGFRDGKPFTPYRPTLELPASLDRVLDFGCGIGRNFPYLTTAARRVVGFDIPPMIARCRDLAPVRIERLEDDWRKLRHERFDLIFAALVLQHVETATCRTYLADFASMAPLVYLLTRTDSDFDRRVLDLVAEGARFTAGRCIEVDHDPQTHQLRILGEASFEDARTRGGSHHYEVMLRSTVSGNLVDQHT